MAPAQLDSSTVAIPWFNNIWLNDTAQRRTTTTTTTPTTPNPSNPLAYQTTASRQSVRSSSRQTVSSLSAAERFSLCSLPSTATCTARQSAQDILRTLSDSNSSDYPTNPAIAVSMASQREHDAHLALQMRILQMSSTVNQGLTRTTGATLAVATPIRRPGLPYSKTR